MDAACVIDFCFVMRASKSMKFVILLVSFGIVSPVGVVSAEKIPTPKAEEVTLPGKTEPPPLASNPTLGTPVEAPIAKTPIAKTPIAKPPIADAPFAKKKDPMLELLEDEVNTGVKRKGRLSYALMSQWCGLWKVFPYRAQLTMV